MKNLFLFIISIAFNCEAPAAPPLKPKAAHGQNISLRKDTILNGKTVYGLIQKSKTTPVHYIISSVDGKALIDIHYSHVDIKDKPLFVVTFLNDNKQAMTAKEPGFPMSFIKEAVKYNLVSKGSIVDTESELKFINAHPVPMGYADVDRLIEY